MVVMPLAVCAEVTRTVLELANRNRRMCGGLTIFDMCFSNTMLATLTIFAYSYSLPQFPENTGTALYT